jgi:hypothetical protein
MRIPLGVHDFRVQTSRGNLLFFGVIMITSNSARKYRRTLHLNNLSVRGDLVVKASHIVAKSKEGSVIGLERYHNVEDLMERAFESAIDSYEKENGEIKISNSGMSASDGDSSEQSE